MPNIATSRIVDESEHVSVPSLQLRQIWPLPRLNGLASCVLFPADDHPDGVDVGYPERSSSPAAARQR